MSAIRIFSTAFFLFVLFTGISNAQYDPLLGMDSSYLKAGPEDLMERRAGKYYDFSDKNKVNIEIVVMGGAATGKYLIPDGTTLFEFIIMAGVTSEEIMEDIKVVSIKSRTPIFQTRNITEFDLANFYGSKKDISKSMQNPLIRPGDMIILPDIKPSNPFGAFYYITQITYFLSSLISFYFLLDRLVRE